MAKQEKIAKTIYETQKPRSPQWSDLSIKEKKKYLIVAQAVMNIL